MSQICGCDFSNSSSRSTEKGCLRTCAISGAACCSVAASPRSRSRLSGVWYSLMSRRTSRSSEPKTKALNALAISVLPVPVGPTKRKTPSGRVGSVSPAFTSAMRSTRQSTASGCPSTLASKKARTRSRLSVARGSSTWSGSPVASLSVEITVSVETSEATPRRIRSRTSSSTRSKFPGDAVAGR
jgi:hypothetical protein